MLKNIFEKMIKINNNMNPSYYFKTIYFSQFIILALVNLDNNNIFVIIVNNNKIQNQNAINKLFLLHVAISYRNIYNKLSKYLLNDKNLFPLIYSQIFFVPFLNNFAKVFSSVTKKIDFVLFGNSEYISSVLFDLNNKKRIYDTGYLIQKNYKSNFIDFSKKNKILGEIDFFGQKLKNNYLKSGDKNLYKIENCIKIELRATFPKPLFIIRFYPILKGVLLIHVFHQYKLSKIQIENPLSNGEYIFEKYKEIDACFFDFFNKLEEINIKEVYNIENFFFEYFFILGNNIKEIGKNTGNINKNLMTYKSKEFDLIYLNKQILQIIKESFGEYYLNNKDKKNSNDLIYKLKKRFGDEYEKYKKYSINNNINDTNNLSEEGVQNYLEKININNIINDNLNKTKNILEFNFLDFIQQFEFQDNNNNIKIKSDEDDNNNIINTNEINLKFPSEYSNVNEYSNLNLTKDNIELIQRNIITSATRTTRTNLISKTSSKTNLKTNSNININNINNNNDININIYNNYGIFNTETRNLKTEEEKEEYPIENEEPFKLDITSIQNNKMNSKDESEFKSILIENTKNN